MTHKHFWLVFIGVAIVVSSVWAGQQPGRICNGSTPSEGLGNAKHCGEKRDCSAPVGGAACYGTSVTSNAVTKECVDGSSNEYCVVEMDICTKSWHCKYEPATNKCIPDFDSPRKDSDGNQIISMEDVPVAKSCVKPYLPLPRFRGYSAVQSFLATSNLVGGSIRVAIVRFDRPDINKIRETMADQMILSA
jgi:hypothetical protein